MNDSIINILDMVAINKYMGWYHDWPLAPDQAVWNVAPGKPLFISEFGGEALYGKHGDAEVKSSWSEDYQHNSTRTIWKCLSISPTCAEHRRGFFLISVLPSVSIHTREGNGTVKDWFPTRDNAKKHGTSCVITITKRKQNNEAQNKTLHGCPPPDLYGLERACPRKE